MCFFLTEGSVQTNQQLVFYVLFPKDSTFRISFLFLIFLDVNECTTTYPCQNSGICMNSAGSYNCDCTGTGYDGTDCIMGMN